MNKRIISLCLALVLLLCLLPAAAPTVAAAGDVAINETNFPDASFRSYVSEELDENGDGVLSPTEIASIKWIDCNTRGIASLQGIEFFVALERLDCSHNVLTSLDAVYNENLTHLDCADNNLFILDPSIFPSLKALVCYYNKLSMLDLSANPKLRWVSCHDNKMYNLHLKGCTELESLSCFDNQLEYLDISDAPNLVDALINGTTEDEGSYTVYKSSRGRIEMDPDQWTNPANLTIGMTLSLDGATSVNYLVPMDELDAYELDSYKMVVNYTDYDRDTGVYSDKTRVIKADPELYVADGVNYYKFVFTGIPAMKLNDRMIAHVEGKKGSLPFISAGLDRNPVQYCYRASENTSLSAELRRTCANMILYAAAAQTMFNYNAANLATADWTDTQESLCDRDVPDWENDTGRDTLASGKQANILGTTLDVNSRVNLRYIMSFESGVDYRTLTMYCTYTTYQDDTVTVAIPGTTWTEYPPYGYAATMNVLNPAEMRSMISAVVKDANGNVVSDTYSTSVQAYGCKVYNNASLPQNLKDLMVAMVNYGDAAKALLKK